MPDFEAIDHAKEWFDNQTGGNIFVDGPSLTKSSGSESIQIPLYGKWGESKTRNLGRIKNVEAPVFMLREEMVNSDDSCQSCLKSGSKDDGTARSRTRFVVQTDEETGESRGFMMTVVPTEEYLASGKDIEGIDYYNRGDDFSGMIVFNHLDGSFANAWKYEEGEVLQGYIPRGVSEEKPNRLKAMAQIEYLICTDTYVTYGGYTSYAGSDCWFSTETFWYYEEYYRYQRDFNNNFDTRKLSGGGSSGGNEATKIDGPYLPLFDPKIETPKTLKITRVNNLDEKQSLLLEKALNELTNDCMEKFVYDKFVSDGAKFNFKMDSTQVGLVGYEPKTKTFSFQDNSCIDATELREELFHAWQDHFYPGGTAQYGNTGKVNIEFEAKLLCDISHVYDGCCYAFKSSPKYTPSLVFEDYINFVESVKKNPSSLAQKNYQKWLKLFNQYRPEYSSSFSPDLSYPDALDAVLLMSDC